MSDPVAPPEVVLWNKAAAVQDEELLFYAGQALAAALVAAREEYEVAHRGRMHAIDALQRVEAERDEARDLLKAALLDLVVEEDDDGAYMPGELPDQIRAFLAGTTSKEPKL